MQFCFARFTVATICLASLTLGVGCAEGDEITSRGAAGRVGGGAGSGGAAGASGAESGGSGGTDTTGSGGTGAVGGTGGSGGTAGRGGAGGVDAGSGKGGSAGGRGGSGGATGGTGGATGGSGGATGGTGGATGGSGGATGGTGGATGGTGGVGGTGGPAGAGGSTDAGTGVDGGGSCPAGVAYCSDFERDLAGSMPVGWTRVGGSDGDWEVFFDTSNVFAQNHASSSTFRLCYPSGAVGAPWTGATTISARMKILAAGSSGTTTAYLCLGYRTGSGGSYACLALEPGSGARIRMNAGSSPTDGPLWPTAITVGTWYDVKISVDASGAVTAYMNGVLLGAYMPASAITGGYVAVATQSSQAAFDTIVVTQP
jgi:hypothetical protein